MFRATKRELGEIYTFFQLLTDGKVSMGNDMAEATDDVCEIAAIEREEHDGTRRYFVEEEKIRIVSGEKDKHGVFTASDDDVKEFARDDFKDAADFVLHLLKTEHGEEIDVPDALESFLDEVKIFDLEAKTKDRTDFNIIFWNKNNRPTGFCVRCMLSPMNPLLDGGRTANIKYEQIGVKFATPTVSKINALPESPTEVLDRMLLIERLGGQLKYADVADKVFRSNLLMIDLHFPRMVAEMLRILHLEGITRLVDVVERIKEINPLKIKGELIDKHHFYEYKIKDFLMALAMGMRPAKVYNGLDSAVEGLLIVDTKGHIVCYHKSRPDVFRAYLYKNTRLERGNLEKDKYGFLERENGCYYFKLNLKIGLRKKK